MLDPAPETLGREHFGLRTQDVESFLGLVDLLLDHSKEIRVGCIR